MTVIILLFSKLDFCKQGQKFQTGIAFIHMIDSYPFQIHGEIIQESTAYSV